MSKHAAEPVEPEDDQIALKHETQYDAETGIFTITIDAMDSHGSAFEIKTRHDSFEYTMALAGFLPEALPQIMTETINQINARAQAVTGG